MPDLDDAAEASESRSMNETRQRVMIFVPSGYANVTEFLRDCQFERVELPSSRLALAAELQRLCCAETEGKFFDCVTENIDSILSALRGV